MHYTIYKITNKIDGKFYIGKHQTKNLDDGYMGSGKLIRRAISKYGVENFKKEILFVFDNEQEMNLKEKELVVIDENSYNLCPGGQGGFGYINKSGFNVDIVTQRKNNPEIKKIATENAKRRKKWLWENDIGWRDSYSQKNSESRKKYFSKNPGTFLGKKHRKDTIERMRLSRKGQNLANRNSQYGTMWITNGKENKKIKKGLDLIPEGYYKGRIINTKE